jgi:arylsulfatase A-like enzyme
MLSCDFISPGGIGISASEYLPGIAAQRIRRLVHPVDVAPTIAAFLGMTPPAAAQGTPLKEVL